MYRKKVKLSENDEGDVVEDHDSEGYEVEDSVNVNNPIGFSVTFELEFWQKIWQVEQNLSRDLMKIDYKTDKNIAAIYNPLVYAEDVHKNYMRKFLKKAPSVLFLGMNPGLFGMCQTSASLMSLYCHDKLAYVLSIFRFLSVTSHR